VDPQAAILLVDDDPISLRVLESILAEAGYRVTAVRNSVAAITLLDQQAFDLVLSDIWMAEADGIEVLHAARSRPQPPEVILLTASISVETAVAALRAGAFNYLMKPIAPDDLLALASEAIERRRADQVRTTTIQRIVAELSQVAGPPGSTPEPAPAAAPGGPDVPARFVRVGALELDRFRHAASFEGQPLHLTPIEFALLLCLADAAGRALSWSDIALITHQAPLAPHEAHELLRVHVRNVRRKIDPAYLVTVRGVGFMLVDPFASA
jgi:DNA-binding response OmpR family regulator